MRKQVILLVLLIAALLVGCGTENKGELTGKIYDSETETLITEKVVLELGGTTMLVEDGEYLFTDLPAGPRMLNVEAEGYEAQSVLVEIERGKTTRKDIYLDKVFELVFTIDEVLVPGADSFPFGEDDSGICTDVNYPYYLGKYQVTYGLWKEVYDWATDEARGDERYFFRNPGLKGSGGADKTDDHPVTMINWPDAIVWCNALTEYYNYQNGTDLSCVYIYRNEPVRDSREDNQDACVESVAEEYSNGYRLPTNREWELAARWQDGINWTPGNHVSGDTTGPCFSRDSSVELSTVFQDFAWYTENSGGSTNPVGKKEPNQLGIYDMSGNVYEFCDSHYADEWRHRNKGGAWSHKAHLIMVGAEASPYPG